MRFVPVKTTEQQAALMLVGVQDRLIRNRTQLANTISRLCCRVWPDRRQGNGTSGSAARAHPGRRVPAHALARELFASQAGEHGQLQAQIDEVETKLTAWHQADECSQRLAQVPSVGPIGARCY